MAVEPRGSLGSSSGLGFISYVTLHTFHVRWRLISLDHFSGDKGGSALGGGAHSADVKAHFTKGT